MDQLPIRVIRKNSQEKGGEANPMDEVDEVLENLTDEMSIEPLIHKLFESRKPEAIRVLIEKLKSKLAKKNDELKRLLSNNHQHLFSCTDLIDQLKEFSASAKDNQRKLEGLQESASTQFRGGKEAGGDQNGVVDEALEGLVEKRVPKIEISEFCFRLKFGNFLAGFEGLGGGDASGLGARRLGLCYLAEGVLGSEKIGEIKLALLSRFFEGLVNRFTIQGASDDTEGPEDALEGGNGDSELTDIEFFSLFFFTEKSLGDALEDSVYAFSEVFGPDFEASDEIFEKYIYQNYEAENGNKGEDPVVRRLFAFSDLLELIFSSIISSKAWNFDVVKLLIIFKKIQQTAGKALQIDPEDLNNKDEAGFRRFGSIVTENRLPDLNPKIVTPGPSEALEQAKNNLNSTLVRAYKDSINRSFNFGSNFENLDLKIFAKYKQNRASIKQWEASVTLLLSESETLDVVLREKWTQFCQSIIATLKQTISIQDYFERVFASPEVQEDDFLSYIENFCDTLEASFGRLRKLSDINARNLESLKLEEDQKSFLEKFEAEFENELLRFLEARKDSEGAGGEFEVLRTILTASELIKKVKKLGFSCEKFSSSFSALQSEFWASESIEGFESKLRTLNEFSGRVGVNKKIGCQLLQDGISLLENDPNLANLGDQKGSLGSLAAYLRAELSASAIKDVEFVKRLRVECRNIVPFYILESQEDAVRTKDPDLKVIKIQEVFIEKVDYLKHLNL